MKEDEIYNQLNSLFSDFFNNSSIKLNPSTTADDIDGWDSFSHIALISRIEEEFNISIPFSAVMDFNNIDALVDFLKKQK